MDLQFIKNLIVACIIAGLISIGYVVMSFTDVPADTPTTQTTDNHTTTTTDSHNVSYVIEIPGDSNIIVFRDGTVSTVPAIPEAVKVTNVFDVKTGILVMQDTIVYDVNGIKTSYKKVIMKFYENQGFVPIWVEQYE